MTLTRTSRYLRIFGLCAITSTVILGGCGAGVFSAATSEQPAVLLPTDEAPHCYGGEWWYYTGRVTTAEGRGYGIEAVVFHDAHLPLVVFGEGWAAHFSVLDESTGRFTYDQGRWLDGAPLLCPTMSGFDLNTPLVQMRGADGQDQVRATMSNAAFAARGKRGLAPSQVSLSMPRVAGLEVPVPFCPGLLAVDLTLEDQRGPILHGETGYVAYGQRGGTYYYSRPAMRAAGTLQIDGQIHDVQGKLWFDRQWGLDLQNPWLRWDWFSLRLEDGTYVMLFDFRDTDPAVAHGTYIPAYGEPCALTQSDFTITPAATWLSPHTGAIYPVAWNIEVPSQGLTVSVTAVANDQELNARSTTLNVYWEGLCSLSGTHNGAAVNGLAYVELTNYKRVGRRGKGP